MSEVVMPKDLRRNVAMRRWLLSECGRDRGAARAVLERCREDVLFYFNAFCMTYDPRRKGETRVPFVTYDYQDEAILKLKAGVDRGRDVGVLKSRDMGASWINVGVFEWFWHFSRVPVSLLMVSRKEDYVDSPGDSKSLFWKLDFILENEPRWLRPRTVKRTSMHLGNGDTGSVIDGESTTGDVARGDRRTAILLDEFAAFETSAGFEAAKSTRDATDCRIFNSTPKGAANAFYELTHNAGTDIVNMHWSRHPAKARGLYRSENGKVVLLDSWRGEVEVRERGTGRARRVAFPSDYPFVLDGKTRSPWYDLQCSRATGAAEIAQELDIDFLGSDYQFFDAAAVEAYRRTWCRDPDAVGDIEFDTSTGEPRFFSPNPKGRLSLWQPLGSDGRYDADRRFVIGADVSAGTGASNSAFVVYERGTNEKVAEWADPTVEPRDFAVVVLAAARFFNDALVVPDRSGPTGEQFVKRYTQDGGFPPLYRRFKDRKISQERADEYGVFLNPDQKTSILILYRSCIGDATVVNRSDRAMGETLQFVRSPRGAVEHTAALNSQDPSGARTAHGDIVIADALACLALTEDASGQESGRSMEPPPDSVAGRMAAARLARIAEDTGSELGEGW